MTTGVPAGSVADLAPLSLADGARLDIVDCTGESTPAGAPVATSLTAAGQDPRRSGKPPLVPSRRPKPRP